MTKRSSIIALLIAFISFFASETFAAIQLNVPASAGKGNAFVATATSDTPTANFRFTWRGATHSAKAVPNDHGQWEAQILLPVPLNEKASKLELRVDADGSKQVRSGINLTDVPRPVQKLTVERKFVDPPASVKERIARDREKVRAALRTTLPERQWTLPMQRPVPGSVSSQFGLKRVFNGQPRGEHRGLDLRGPQGTPIHACADGVVVLVDDLYYSGNTAYINHGEGVFSAYLHMSETNVKPGDKIRRGDIVGKIGATGRVTGPHLHLSMFAQGQPVDPLPLLERTAAPASTSTPGRAANE